MHKKSEMSCKAMQEPKGIKKDHHMEKEMHKKKKEMHKKEKKK